MEKFSLICGIIIGALLMYLLIHLLWRLGYYTFCAILTFLRRSENPSGNRPGKRSNLEPMVVPQIQKEIPDFLPEDLKHQAEQELRSRFSGRQNFCISDLQITAYRKGKDKRSILLEATLSWQEKRPVYRVADLHMETAFEGGPSSCPGCGAAVSASDRHCRNCGAPIPKTKIHWKITDCRLH